MISAYAYIERPANCHFEGQDPGEKILLLLRAHPVTYLSWVVLSIFIFLIPFAVFKLAPLIGFNLALLPQNYQSVGLIIDWLLVFIVLFEAFLHWYFNVTIITTEKMITMDFEPLLYKAVDLAPLVKIEEADCITAGTLETLFNFGNVTVQTAGAKAAIEMRSIPHPAAVADMILDLIGKHPRVGTVEE